MMATAPARPSSSDRIRAALWFAERGFGVFSVWSTTDAGTCRCPKGAACDNPGKHPITARGFHDATTDPARITTLLSAGSEPNYGLVPPEGVFVLDVDGDGVAHLAELEALYGPLPATLRTNTAHGQHVFLRWPDGLPRPLGKLWGYVTRWGTGATAGYVIGPRSVHASGAIYTPNALALEIATVPDAWAQSVLAKPPASDGAYEIPAGGYQLPDFGYTESRYDAIRDFIASRYMRGISLDEMWVGVRDVLAPRFSEPLTEPDLRSRFERAWKGTPEKLGPPQSRERGAPSRPRTEAEISASSIDAADLLELDIPPLSWIVPELIPEGTTVLAGPPKLGKSCLVYQVAVEVALGGELLTRKIDQGDVLYLALEDGKRRGQTRLRAALGERLMPRGRLEVRWSSAKIGGGLEAEIVAWLDSHPHAKLVAIDTLQKVRGRADSRRNAYEVDVEDLGRLQDLFRDRPVGLLIVHHSKKDAGDDFLASVSGTYGITGSVDTTLVIQRKRLETFGKLVVTGRDVEEIEEPVRFDGLLWQTAPRSVAEKSFERAEVYKTIEQRGPIFPTAIAELLGSKRTAVQNLVDKMVTDGSIARTMTGYIVAAPIQTESPESSSHEQTAPNDDSGDSGPRARARTRVPGDSGDSDDSPFVTESSEPPPTHVRVREAAWAGDCHYHSEHRSAHRWTAAGWVCDICSPESAS